MEQDKIPTAEELWDKFHDPCENIYTGDVLKAMKEFAKLHVKAVLEVAAKKAVIVKNFEGPFGEEYIDERSILDSYPEENIK